MGKNKTMNGTPLFSGRLLRLNRGRPRSFAEWSALRRWGKLPDWELDVAGFVMRQARQDAGVTQVELAKSVGITQQAVSRAEQWSSNPTVDLMRCWLAACGLRLKLVVGSE